MTDAQREELRRLAEIREEVAGRAQYQGRPERRDEFLVRMLSQAEAERDLNGQLAAIAAPIIAKLREDFRIAAASLAQAEAERDLDAKLLAVASASVKDATYTIIDLRKRAAALAAENALLREALEQQRQWHGRQPFEYRHQPQIDLIDAALKGAGT